MVPRIVRLVDGAHITVVERWEQFSGRPYEHTDDYAMRRWVVVETFLNREQSGAS